MLLITCISLQMSVKGMYHDFMKNEDVKAKMKMRMSKHCWYGTPLEMQMEMYI